LSTPYTFTCTPYTWHDDKARQHPERRRRVAALGGRLVPTTAIVAGTLLNDWLVEIEVIAAD
jgi:2-iminobutanoate/2-iminopropanoate deaminase